MNCLVCGKEADGVWATLDAHTAVQCSNCKFVWIDPMPNEQELDKYYSTYHSKTHSDSALVKLRKEQYLLDKKYIESFLPPGHMKMLDIGCAEGLFLSVFSDSFEKWGTEIGDGVEKAKEKFGDNIFHGKLTEFEHEPKSFDLIVMRGVIEHLLNPNEYMDKVMSLLKDDGVFFITATPNVDSFCAHIYREKWNQFTPPSHLLYFSDKTIMQYLSKFGLKVIAKDFPYLDTPYANVELDNKAMFEACAARIRGNFETIKTSRAFWGNMMSIVAKRGDK